MRVLQCGYCRLSYYRPDVYIIMHWLVTIEEGANCKNLGTLKKETKKKPAKSLKEKRKEKLGKKKKQ